jgi:hypothetical protein
MYYSTHPAALVGVAVLLVCAGCSGLPTDDGSGEPVDDSLSTITYPDGWSANGVDPSTALRTHRQTLTGQPRESRIEITDDDGDNRTVSRAVSPDSQTALIRFEDTTFSTDVETYYTARSVYEYDHTTDTIADTRNETWNSTTTGFQADNTILRPIRNLNITAQESVRIAGHPAVNYSVRGLADMSRTPPDNASGYIVVSEQGYITAFDIRKSNEDYIRRYSYDLTTGDSVSVSIPVWLSTD